MSTPIVSAMLCTMLAIASPLPCSIDPTPLTHETFLVRLDGNENITSTSYRPDLHARQARPYQEAVEKGKKLWEMMRNPDENDQRGGKYTDLAKWGWVESQEKRLEIIQEKTGGLEEAFQACHLQFNEKTSTGISMVHKKDTIDSGKTYLASNLKPSFFRLEMFLTLCQATYAEYSSIFNAVGGAVVIYTAHSPAYMLEASGTTPSKDNMPGISHPSDVLYLTWKNYAPSTPLRYVFVRGITSQSQPTRDIIWQALRSDNPSLKAPPQGWKNRHMFKRPGQNGERKKCDEPFYAVLGTFNFRTIAYMIAQHREMFRGKVISSIYIWGEGDYLHGMAHVA
ncbi:hypothetical protein AC578_10423 [Pseudocercospora eumusae]|uniref:Enterotoxin n=1 Tax=Pseudocercospora eumusae TaxID=321146 RepID=A0A139HBD6_9PEZI|nr:hypothetical protein AC578_10423 [Pseudocercospora eumusae]